MTNNRISEMARKYTDHSMIEAHASLPPYPETRARLLFCFLQGSQTEKEQELYALAVSLAQLGLETHDLVDETPKAESLGQARTRQIKVLAGDYFNGRFYQILSQADRVDIVKLVTKAISEVNRLKVNLYERFRALKLTAEEYLEHSVAIRSELFLAFAKFIPIRNAERFSELFRSFVRCEMICEELNRSSSSDIRYGWAFWYILQIAVSDDRERMIDGDSNALNVMLHKYKVHGILAQMLQSQVNTIKRFVEQLDSESLKAEISRLAEPFASLLSVPKVAEEI